MRSAASFEERTNTLKFFKDLEEKGAARRNKFEKSLQPRLHEHSAGSNVYAYDLRREAAEVKEEADLDLIYNIQKFLIGARAELSEKLEKQRLQMLMPSSSSDLLRVTETSELERLKQIFDRNGYISKEDFVQFFSTVLRDERRRISGSTSSALMSTCSLRPDQLERNDVEGLKALFHAVDSDDAGVVTWDQLIKFMAVMRERALNASLSAEGSLKLHVERARGTVVKHKVPVATISSVPSVPTILCLYHTTLNCSQRLALVDKKTMRRTHDVPLHHATSLALHIPPSEGDPVGSMIFTATLRNSAIYYKLSPNTDIPPYVAGQSHLRKSPVAAAWHAHARKVVCGTSDGDVIFLDPTPSQHQEVVSVHDRPITAITVAPQKYFAYIACIDSGLGIADLEKGKLAARFAPPNDDSGGIHTLEYLSEVGMLASGGYSNLVRLWMSTPSRLGDGVVHTLMDEVDPHCDHVVATWQDKEAFPHVLTSIDAQGMIKLWDLRRNQCLQTTYLAQYSLTALSAAPGGERTLYVLESGTDTHRCEVSTVMLSQEVSCEQAQTLHANTTQHAAVLHDPLLDVAISAVDRSIYAYSLASGTIGSFLPSVAPPGHVITCAALESSGKKVFYGTDKGKIMCVTISTGEERIEFLPLLSSLSSPSKREAGCVNAKPAEATAIQIFEKDETILVGFSEGSLLVFPYIRNVTSFETFNPIQEVNLRTYHGRKVGVTAISPACGSDMIAVTDSSGIVFQFCFQSKRLICRRFSDEQGDFSLPTPVERSDGRPTPVAELNFATDRSVYNAVEGGVAEVRAVCDLFPFGAFISADTKSTFRVWARYPSAPSTKLATWEHFTPRQVCSSASKSVVAAMTFSDSEMELACCDDQGCLVIYDLTSMIRGTRLWDLCEATANAVDDEGLGGSGDKLGSSSGGAVVSLVEYPSTDMAIKNCFIIVKGKPLTALHFIADRNCFVIGEGSGNITLLQRDGTILGHLAPDPKFQAKPFPKYFYNRAEVVEAARKRAQSALNNEAKRKWHSLRRQVVGMKTALRQAVKEYVDVAKQVKDALELENAENVCEQWMDGSVRGGEEAHAMSSAARHRPAGPLPTPPNTPTAVRNLEAEWRVVVRSEHSEVLFDAERSPKNVYRHLVDTTALFEVTHDSDLAATDGGGINAVAAAVAQKLQSACAALFSGIQESMDSEEERLVGSVLLPRDSKPPLLYDPSLFNAFCKPMQHTEHFAAVPEDFAPLPPWATPQVTSTPCTITAPGVEQPVLPVHQFAMPALPQPFDESAITFVDDHDDDQTLRACGEIDRASGPSTSLLSTGAAKKKRSGINRSVAEVKPCVLVSHILPSTAVRRPATPHASAKGTQNDPKKSFAALLHASALQYPLQPSPFFEPGRVAPALTPFLFPQTEEVLVEVDDVRGGSSGMHMSSASNVDTSSIPSAQRSRGSGSRRFMQLMMLNAHRTSLLNRDIVRLACNDESLDDPRTREAQAERAAKEKTDFTIGQMLPAREVDGDRRPASAMGLATTDKIRKGRSGLIGGPINMGPMAERPVTASRAAIYQGDTERRARSSLTLRSPSIVRRESSLAAGTAHEAHEAKDSSFSVSLPRASLSRPANSLATQSLEVQALNFTKFRAQSGRPSSLTGQGVK